MTFVLLGAFLGVVGGVIRLPTIHEKTALQITISLMWSCAIGTIAGIVLYEPEPSKILLTALLALGYVGADFSERW
jgi:hypothetical protein